MSFVVTFEIRSCCLFYLVWEFIVFLVNSIDRFTIFWSTRLPRNSIIFERENFMFRILRIADRIHRNWALGPTLTYFIFCYERYCYLFDAHESWYKRRWKMVKQSSDEYEMSTNDTFNIFRLKIWRHIYSNMRILCT